MSGAAAVEETEPALLARSDLPRCSDKPRTALVRMSASTDGEFLVRTCREFRLAALSVAAQHSRKISRSGDTACQLIAKQKHQKMTKGTKTGQYPDGDQYCVETANRDAVLTQQIGQAERR